MVKTAPRAVGKACGANPIPIIIPCHRVVGAHSIGGYSGRGGHDTKAALLNLENRKTFASKYASCFVSTGDFWELRI